MKEMSYDEIMDVLKATSRTFFLPISQMPTGLQEATTSAYLCMRAIDEIEDHPSLPNTVKAELLQQVSLAFQTEPHLGEADHHLDRRLAQVFAPVQAVLPVVSLRLGVWAAHAPASIAPRIWDATAAMADRMAHWAACNWAIRNTADLDTYTYCVAGSIGLLMCDVLAWFDGAQLDRRHAIQFGRGLQVTNIVRNRKDDLARGVDFYPPGWSDQQMREYAAHWLTPVERYAATLPPEPFSYFIRVPLALAQATLEALAQGRTKLTRESVLQIASSAAVAAPT